MKLVIAFGLALGILSSQDFENLGVQQVAKDFRFTEGPVWSHEGYLLFSDVPGGKLVKYTPEKGAAIFRDKTNGPNGNTYDARGRLYTCESDTRRVVRTEHGGKAEVVADRFEGKRLNAPNDIVVRKDGHAWFTDPAFGSSDKTRELDFYGVYHLSPKGTLEAIAKPKGRPNGIALSPDGKILYVANTDEKNVRAYDVDRSGQATNERVIVSGIEGAPDGIKVDENGNLYVAAKGVVVYSPAGKHLGTIPIPETPSNCAFGDADLQSLYVTARTSLYRVRLEVKGSVQY